MLKLLVENKFPLTLIILHLVLGVLSSFSAIFFIVYFYFFIFSSIPYVVRFRNINSYLSVFLVYIISFEMLARMSKTSPYIPYEVGKYIMFLGLILGIIVENRRGIVGYLMLLCLIPAFFFDMSGQVQFKDYIFNGIGPINICLAIIYFYKHKFSEEGFKILLRFITYPILSVLGYILIKTPDLSEMEFSLGANVSTTGGFGSNQVATVLGLTMFLIFIFWVNRWKYSGNRMIDMGLICLFAFQGLLSFSRGGMVGGALGILIFVMVIQLSGRVKKKYKLPNLGKYVIIGSFALVLIFLLANWITDGYLLLRYQGETVGTLAGVKEKNLNALTTGRLEIFLEDTALFLEYPATGVGVAASKYLRDTSRGTVAHVELGRLLSDHGILGLLNFLLLLFLAFNLFFINKHPVYKAIVIGFYVIGVYSTFHSATRTVISPLLIGLSLVWVIELKNQKARETKILHQ